MPNGLDVKLAKWTSFGHRVQDDEMHAFLGILILMGIDPMHEVADYWSMKRSLRNEFIAGVMSRNRFQKIMQYFHCNDADQDSANMVDIDERRIGHDEITPCISRTSA